MAMTAQENSRITVSIHETARILLFQRLRGLVATEFALGANDFLMPHVGKDKVYIFFIHNEKAGHLEDETLIYPSDRLITQIRLLWS